jgi:arsenic resistance protein ArsH
MNNNAPSLPNISTLHFDVPTPEKLSPAEVSTHPPRILLLYGSLREKSYSRLLTLEAERLLQRFGAQTRVFDPHGLPMVDSCPPDHPKVQKLRQLSAWSEGQVWCSPKRHGAMTGVFKSQIDWLPLEVGSIRPTQGPYASGHADVWRLAELQCCEPTARARPLDEDGDDSQPVLGRQGVPGIQR